MEMSWPDDSFDLVWACESGEHMPDKKKYVEEMVRVLKPGKAPLSSPCFSATTCQLTCPLCNSSHRTRILSVPKRYVF